MGANNENKEMNVLRHVWFTLLVIFLCCYTLSASAWEVWVFDGKTGPIPNDAPGCESIRSAYETALPVVCPWETDPRHADCFKLDHLEENTRDLGEWEGFRVAYVFDEEQEHRAILLQDPETGWHFVFIQFRMWSEGTSAFQPEIWNVDGHSILSGRMRIDGSGGWHLELYWIKDPNSGKPRLLDLTAIEEAQNRVMPPDCDTRCKSGTLDLRNRSYTRFAWSPRSLGWSDPEGTIDMSLAIEGTRVVVSGARWIPMKEE